MRDTFTPRGTRKRILGAIAAVVVLCIGMAYPTKEAQGRVDPTTQEHAPAVLSADTIGIATGGGTVTVTGVPNVVASFGINGKRPTGFAGGGGATGRISYSKHAQVAGRHTNVPVIFMSLELSGNPSPNGMGGKAQLVGDCSAAQAECPAGTGSVLVYVEDNSDTGANDVFNITYCAGPAGAPPLIGCGAAEGGSIRTGQIQIRATGPGGAGPSVPTAARAPLRVP
jgi:hypothetical protein